MKHLIDDSGAIPLESLYLADGVSHARVKLPGGHALSRSYFDFALIEAAIKKGVTFLPGVSAKVLNENSEHSSVQISNQNMSASLSGKITIIADGLSGHALDQLPGFEVEVAPRARFGCGITFPNSSAYYQPGCIYMACHRGGYVGLVKIENGGIDIAAALDRTYSREVGSLAAGVAKILNECGLKLPVSDGEFYDSAWRGTDSLTRTRKIISDERIFVIGDSCGYPEPLTGEGIAWALESAESVFPLALKGIARWENSLCSMWQSKHRNLVDQRKFKSRVIAYGLRNDHIRKTSIQILSRFPSFGQIIASGLTKHSKPLVS
ncbi:MAG: hypothetical protein IAF58_15520 [Leptolyngbya sp.]|nr:hypothetical protein [Candidatus Melainabacteria bacterium]